MPDSDDKELLPKLMDMIADQQRQIRSLERLVRALAERQGMDVNTLAAASSPAPATSDVTLTEESKPVSKEPTKSTLSPEIIRQRLASARTVLDNLSAEASTWELNRKLAYLQAEASSLQGGDMLNQQAEDLDQLLQFQTRLRESIADKHQSAQSDADPSSFAMDEVKRLEKVVSDIDECVSEQMDVGAAFRPTDSGESKLPYPEAIRRVEEAVDDIDEFVADQLSIGLMAEGGITRDKLDRVSRQANDAFTRLVERQHHLADGFLNNDLSLVDGQIDISPDLVGFCRHRCPDSKLLKPERAKLCQFANGEGPLHAQVVTHLENVRHNCRILTERHDEQKALVEEAKSLADKGEFDAAETALKRVDPMFTDLGTGQVREQIGDWRRKLTELESQFASLKEVIETPRERPFAQPWKVMKRERRLLSLAENFEDRLETFRREVNASENEEFIEQAVALHQKLSSQLNDLANLFQRESSDAKISTFLHFALLVECAIGLTIGDPKAQPIILWTIGLLSVAGLFQFVHIQLLRRTTVDFDLETNGRSLEDKALASIFLNGRRYQSGSRIAQGTYHLTLDSDVFEPLKKRIRIHYGRTNRLGTIPVRLSRDTFVNTLEMKFVPVSGTTVMFSIWPARVRDFLLFVRENNRKLQRPRFKQDDRHPVVNVSWEDARAFCRWLTERDRRAKRIGHRDEYRLPTDLEWSAAVSLENETGKTPAERSGKIKDHFPWGMKFPPSRDCANVDPTLKADPYDFTCAVGKLQCNKYGLYDLSGNVWEWCDDLYDGKSKNRTLRGGSWHTATEEMLLSSYRLSDSPGHRVELIGFRCVLEIRKPSPLFSNLHHALSGANTETEAESEDAE